MACSSGRGCHDCAWKGSPAGDGAVRLRSRSSPDFKHRLGWRCLGGASRNVRSGPAPGPPAAPRRPSARPSHRRERERERKRVNDPAVLRGDGHDHALPRYRVRRMRASSVGLAAQGVARKTDYIPRTSGPATSKIKAITQKKGETAKLQAARPGGPASGTGGAASSGDFTARWFGVFHVGVGYVKATRHRSRTNQSRVGVSAGAIEG